MAGGAESAAAIGADEGGFMKGIGGGFTASGVVTEFNRIRHVSAFDDGKPSVLADIDFNTGAAGVNWSQTALRAYTAASRTWLLTGTNAASANSVLHSRGGVTLTTAGANGDEMIISPLIINGVYMTPFGKINWSPEYQVNFQAIVRLPDTITSMRIVVGLKLTASAERQETASGVTDDDYVLFVYDTGHASSAGLWHYAVGVSGTDFNSAVDSARTRKSTVRAGDVVQLDIKIDNNRIPHFYIDQVEVGVGVELNSALHLIPVEAVVALTAAAREVTFLPVDMSQNY